MASAPYLLTNEGVQWDDRGPYYRTSAGGKYYIPPVTAAQSSDPRLQDWARSRGAAPGRSAEEGGTKGTSVPQGSLLRTQGTWNPESGQYDQGINWHNLMNIGTGALVGGGIVNALSTPTGTAAAAGPGGTLPASQAVPTSVAMTATPASIASQGASAGIPLGGVVANAATNAATNGGGLGSRVLDALTSDNAMGALASLAPLLAGMGGNGGAPQMDPQLSRIIGINEAQMRRADPLHQAAVQLAFGGLPTYARQGITPNNVPLPQ